MEWKTGLPEKPGHFLVLWDTEPSRSHPMICSQYDVLYWCGKWYAPVDEKQPVLFWMELPEKPIEEA